MPYKNARQIGEYWKEHVVSWEAGAYYRDRGGRATLWDRLSSFFRGNGMYVRMEAALRFVGPHIKGLTALDLGCASGRLAFKLVEAGAKHVIGVDISPEAVAEAEKRRIESPFADRLEFKVMDLASADARLPSVDLVTSLGVIEYFDQKNLDELLGRIQTRYFLFDFPDADGRRRAWLIWNLRQVYLRLVGCPGVYLYTQEEFTQLADRHGLGRPRFMRNSIFDYVTNLPAP
jgi:SAM-dependent methyltransferase